MLYATRAGGTVINVTGAGFTASSVQPGSAAAQPVAYFCLFLTRPEAFGTAPFNATDVARRTVRATLLGPTALQCATPSWTSRFTANLSACPSSTFASTAVFRIRKAVSAAANQTSNVTVGGTSADYFLFQFLGEPSARAGASKLSRRDS